MLDKFSRTEAINCPVWLSITTLLRDVYPHKAGVVNLLSVVGCWPFGVHLLEKLAVIIAPLSATANYEDWVNQGLSKTS